MKQEQIFSKDFLNLDYKVVSKELNEKGYFSFDKALTDDFVNKKESRVKNNIYESKIDNIIDHFAITETKRPDGSIILRTVYDLKLKRFEVIDYSAEQNKLVKCK